jgi:hypothetical protein
MAGSLGRHELQVVAAAAQDAEARRNERRRVRAMPIYQAETSREMAWVDIFASKGNLISAASDRTRGQLRWATNALAAHES